MAERTPMQPEIILGKGRLSFPNVWEARQNEQGGLRYEATILLPPDYDLKPLRAALHAAAVAEWGANEKTWPKRLRGPDDVIRDCAEKERFAGYQKGWHFVATALPGLDRNGKTRPHPQVFDALRQPVLAQAELYAGRWVKLAVRPYAYTKPQQGVSLALLGVQLLAHAEPFTGSDARSLFDDEVEEMGEVEV
jgi:hypothetical protein